MSTILRILTPAFILGAIGFTVGFFGPLVWAPEANQGPLLGIFFTGPFGFALGLLWGVFREVKRHNRERNGEVKR